MQDKLRYIKIDDRYIARVRGTGIDVVGESKSEALKKLKKVALYWHNRLRSETKEESDSSCNHQLGLLKEFLKD